MSVLFGQRSPRFNTPATEEFFHVQHLWEHALEPGAHPPVDLLPILQKVRPDRAYSTLVSSLVDVFGLSENAGQVPERFAAWKQLCTEVRRLQRKLYFGLLEEVEKRTARGEANGCWMETVCARAEEWSMDRELVGCVLFLPSPRPRPSLLTLGPYLALL